MSSEALSERELEEIENEISVVVKEENEEADWKFRTQVIGEFALNLIEDFRRSQNEAAELRERVGELEGALQKAEEYLSANIALMYQRHDYLIPSDGLPEEKLRDELRAALSRQPAKLGNQEESVEKPEVES